MVLKNEVRVIAGRFRSRKITFLNQEGLRPTTDRVRETLFNWLSSDIIDAHCLDLFAGSGILGIEALSRYAKSLCFVDKKRKNIEQLKKNLFCLDIENATLFNQDAFDFLKTNHHVFDIIFLDPPFKKELLLKTLHLIDEKASLKKGGGIYFETELNPESLSLPKHYEIKKSKKAGAVYYGLIVSSEG